MAFVRTALADGMGNLAFVKRAPCYWITGRRPGVNLGWACTDKSPSCTTKEPNVSKPPLHRQDQQERNLERRRLWTHPFEEEDANVTEREQDFTDEETVNNHRAHSVKRWLLLTTKWPPDVWGQSLWDDNVGGSSDIKTGPKHARSWSIFLCKSITGWETKTRVCVSVGSTLSAAGHEAHDWAESAPELAGWETLPLWAGTPPPPPSPSVSVDTAYNDTRWKRQPGQCVSARHHFLSERCLLTQIPPRYHIITSQSPLFAGWN